MRTHVRVATVHMHFVTIHTTRLCLFETCLVLTHCLGCMRSKSAHPLRGIEEALACAVPSSREHAIPNGLSPCCAGDGHGVRPGYHPAARRPCALKPCPAASLPPRSPQAPHSTSPLGNCSDQVDLYSSGAACRVCVCCSNATPRMLATSNTNTNGTRLCPPFRTRA